MKISWRLVGQWGDVALSVAGVSYLIAILGNSQWVWIFLGPLVAILFGGSIYFLWNRGEEGFCSLGFIWLIAVVVSGAGLAGTFSINQVFGARLDMSFWLVALAFGFGNILCFAMVGPNLEKREPSTVGVCL